LRRLPLGTQAGQQHDHSGHDQHDRRGGSKLPAAATMVR
jgi:hypothetical protein